jgi:hypothetical protein
LKENLDRLRGEWTFLQDTWCSTREHWLDSVGDGFEQRFWSQWEQVSPHLLSRMEELEEILYRIKADSDY